MIIKFGDNQVFAHKVILARGSLWFDRALAGSFSVDFPFLNIQQTSLTSVQEANKKVVELHDDANPDAIMAMLKHLYGSDYKKQDWVEHEAHNIEVHLSVFILGDKYDISSLRVQAAALFKRFMDTECEHESYYAQTIYAIQKLIGPNAPQLADKALAQYTRDVVLDYYDYLFDNETFRSLMAEGSMLQKDLAMDVLDKINDRV